MQTSLYSSYTLLQCILSYYEWVRAKTQLNDSQIIWLFDREDRLIKARNAFFDGNGFINHLGRDGGWGWRWMETREREPW